MTELIALLMKPWAKIAAAFLAALAAVAGIYARGRSDQKSKTQLKDLENANRIRKDGAAARADADRRPAGQLRDDDGWRRD